MPSDGAFPNARLIAQRLQHEVASAGHPRFVLTRSQWDQPTSRYQLVDGDTELLPGLELIETSGHVPGHQSVLVHLPQTGPVLLAIDAVTMQAHFTADRPVGPMDVDGVGAIASTRKLLDLVERKHISLIIFGHDGPQWSTLKQPPTFSINRDASKQCKAVLVGAVPPLMLKTESNPGGLLQEADVSVTATRYVGPIHGFVMLNAIAELPAARAAITDELLSAGDKSIKSRARAAFARQLAFGD